MITTKQHCKIQNKVYFIAEMKCPYSGNLMLAEGDTEVYARSNLYKQYGINYVKYVKKQSEINYD